MKKIAVITQDGKTINQHFGRAPYYAIFSIEEGKIVNQELREKMGHSHFASQHSDHAHDPSQPHGMDQASRSKHMQMADAIADCEVLICGGMGLGARKHMEERGIKVIMSEITSIEEAVSQWLAGTIVDRRERAH